ncbi:MAG: hypothetical protein MUC50_18345 [Myxococcota bacterium]|jgi:hypothetical protein|nr:hypothetical protein [Myxococcota bacterium]
MIDPVPPSNRDLLRDRFLRRFGLAVAISLLLHLAVAVVFRPDFRAVQDRVGLKDIVDLGIEQGQRREKAPLAQPPAENEPEVPRVAPEPKARPKAPDGVAISAPSTDSSPKDTASTTQDTAQGTATESTGTDTDQGTSTDSSTAGTDSGQGEALCLHDLFAYSESKPTWALWLSLFSLRGTVFEQEVSRALRSFELTRELAAATGLDPGSDIEGLLVASSNVFDWRTYEVMATYDTGEERLRAHLTRTLGTKPGAVMVSTPSGWEINVPGEQRYHLLGSGRVLLSAYSEPRQAPTAPSTDSRVETAEARHRSHGDNPAWPKQVHCLKPSRGHADSEPAAAALLSFDPAAARVKLLGSALRPLLYANKEGRAPVMAMATTDPRALGLGRGSLRGGLKVSGAVLRAYFGQNVQLQAFVSVEGDPAGIAAIVESWKLLIRASAQDTFLRMTGLSAVLPRIEVTAVDRGVTLSVTLSTGEVRAALVFMQMQGKVLGRGAAR